MKQPEERSHFGSEGGPEEEKMVEATKISTVFPDQKVLEQIADSLLLRGLISGFHIDRVLSGYVHRGSRVEENQYSLEILLDNQTDERVKGEIRRAIEDAIGKKWEVPAIEEERVRVNRELFGFIKRAEVEHRKYVRERRWKLTIALSALLSISATMGTFTKKYFDEREQRVVATERVKSYKRMTELENRISRQISELEARIAAGKPLTVAPSDMAAVTDYEETQRILDTIREARDEMRKLSETEEK